MDRGVTRASTETVIPRYHQALDFEALWREFLPAPDYFSGTYRLSRDELRMMQEQRAGEGGFGAAPGRGGKTATGSRVAAPLQAQVARAGDARRASIDGGERRRR
jgi:hypothetical protein